MNLLGHALQHPDGNLATLGGYLFWTVVYILSIKRGFQDRSFAIPMLALCINVSWEFMFSFLYAQSAQAQVGNIIWWVMDVVILFTCLKYGREDYRHPLVQKWFFPFVAVCFVMAAAVEWALIRGFEDYVGLITGTGNTLFTVALMLAMILRRNSVKGQSLYIGLAVLLGNACGYIMVIVGQSMLKPASAMILLHVCWWCILFISTLYVVLVFRQSRIDGFNPWTRF